MHIMFSQRTCAFDVAARRLKLRRGVFRRLCPAEELCMMNAVGCILAEFIKCFNSLVINSSRIGLFNLSIHHQ